jgi:hypothetical protein
MQMNLVMCLTGFILYLWNPVLLVKQLQDLFVKFDEKGRHNNTSHAHLSQISLRRHKLRSLLLLHLEPTFMII